MSRYLSLAFLLCAWVTATVAQEDPSQTYVKLTTSSGDIYLELYPDRAPESVGNFLKYVESGFYNGTIFHRVIPDFVIQGGGFTREFEKKETRGPIPNEAGNGLKNERWTVAMARTADPHSATSQFYINMIDNPALDHTGETHSRAWGYAVFGRVIAGMEVVEAIRSIPTGPGGPFRSDVPREPIVIQSAEVVDALPATPAPDGVEETEPAETADST